MTQHWNLLTIEAVRINDLDSSLLEKNSMIKCDENVIYKCFPFPCHWGGLPNEQWPSPGPSVIRKPNWQSELDSSGPDLLLTKQEDPRSCNCRWQLRDEMSRAPTPQSAIKLDVCKTHSQSLPSSQPHTPLTHHHPSHPENEMPINKWDISMVSPTSVDPDIWVERLIMAPTFRIIQFWP